MKTIVQNSSLCNFSISLNQGSSSLQASGQCQCVNALYQCLGQSNNSPLHHHHILRPESFREKEDEKKMEKELDSGRKEKQVE